LTTSEQRTTSPIIPMAPPSPFLPAEARLSPIGLAASRDAVKTAEGWEATSDEPWPRLEVDASALAGPDRTRV
jgi:hypothetical protein